MDFGIVKELMPAGEGQSLSQVFGKTTYFSPEQSQGSNVGQKADLYSVGVLLYELLSGRPPFTGSSADVALKHRQEPPPPLPQESELSALCMALLRKEPDARPTAREALAMIRVDAASVSQTFEFIGRVHERRVLHDALVDARTEGRVVVVEDSQASVRLRCSITRSSAGWAQPCFRAHASARPRAHARTGHVG